MRKKRLLKKGLRLLACLSLLVAGPIMALSTSSTNGVATPTSDAFASSKRSALDLAGALINHGFRIRDDAWMVTLMPKKPVFLQVTLFEGNQYWFVAATTTASAHSLKITLYDASGHSLPVDSWKENLTVLGGRAAGGIVAPHSGKYFVGLELRNAPGNAKTDACLIYAYQ